MASFETTNRDAAQADGQTTWYDAVERASAGIKEAARSLAKTLGTARTTAPEANENYPPALAFSELPVFQSMNKHRWLASMFGLKNPFYRSHDGRLGATSSTEISLLEIASEYAEKLDIGSTSRSLAVQPFTNRPMSRSS